MIMDQPNEDENTSSANVFPVPPHIWITLGSVLFLMLPSSCHILYMGHGNYILGRTCTTGSEWLWIGTFSALLLLPLVVDRFSPRSNRSNNNHHHPAATQPPPPPPPPARGVGQGRPRLRVPVPRVLTLFQTKLVGEIIDWIY